MDKYYEKYAKEYEQKPKHKKRKDKSAPKKADHKHEYTEYIGVMDTDGRKSIFPVSKCEMCGKRTRDKICFTYKEPGYYALYLGTVEDVKKYYPELEVLDVDNECI